MPQIHGSQIYSCICGIFYCKIDKVQSSNQELQVTKSQMGNTALFVISERGTFFINQPIMRCGFFFALTFLLAGINSHLQLVNNGATITVQPGATMKENQGI